MSAESYTDPEGTVRIVEPGFNGIKPNMGAGHARAVFIDGKIVAFDYNTLPGTGGAAAQFTPQTDAYTNPTCTVAGVAGGVPGSSDQWNYAVGDQYGQPSGGMATGAAGSAQAKLDRIAAIVKA